MSRLGRLGKTQVHRKGKYDWVTDADQASERAVLKVIRKAFPNDSIMAEESAPDTAAATSQWLIDPLDGTVNYMHAFPMFSVSIALRRKGRLQVGVVYDPWRNELFTARRGGGAFLNGRRIHVTQNRTLEKALLATGFPFRAKDKMDLYIQSFRTVFMQTGSIRRAGSAAIDLAYIACGRMDGFWELALSPWDVAAGALLIEEAGGSVSGLFGRPDYLETGHIIGGNHAIHKHLVKLLTPVFRGRIEN